MSASVIYQPIGGKYLKGATSNTVSTLEKIFGKLPRIFTCDDVGHLRAMAAVHDGAENPYEQLADAIVRHGSIQVRVESW